MPTPKTIYISATEVSGDRHAANLVNAIKARNPNVMFIGTGGHYLREAGVKILSDITHHSTVGLFEVFVHLPKLLMALHKAKTAISSIKPDLILTIDAQGFHVPLLKQSAKKKLSSMYYIAPQEWHWGTEAGGQAVVDTQTQILALFQQEYAFYKKLGAKVTFVGHPLLDTTLPDKSEQEFRQELGLGDTPILALFPGSRTGEFNRVAPLLFKAAKQVLAQSNTPIKLVVSLASPTYKAQLEQLILDSHIDDVLLYEGNSHNLITYAKASIITSGTVAMEHAILGTPAVAAYRFHPLTYWVGKRMLKKRLGRIPYMCMMNELLNKEAMPEYLQEKANPTQIAKQVLTWLNNPESTNQLRADYTTFRELLGEPGSIERAAEAILKNL